jgi:hypothetical protein
VSGSQEAAWRSEPPPDVLTGPFTIPAISEMGMGERETLTGPTSNRCAKPRDQGDATGDGCRSGRHREAGDRRPPAGPPAPGSLRREEALGCSVGAPDPAV